MKPLSESRVFSWLCIVFLIGVLTMILSVAYAGGDDIIQSNDNNAQTTGDVSVGGDSSKAFGVGMGDVDIAQCMASKSTPLYQWLKFNKWCMAETLDAKGLHEAAAKVRCSINEYSKVFQSNQECIALSTAETQEFPVKPSVDEDDEDGPDRHLEALYARVSDLETEKERILQKMEKTSQKAREAARMEPKTIIQDFITEDKRAKLAALRDEK